MKRFTIIFPLLLFIAFAGCVLPAHAAKLAFVSDTISDSRNATPANHAIVFQVPSGVPASGEIVVAFENTPFSVDPSLSFTDIDLAVSTSSPYSGFVDRNLAASPDVADDGAAVTPTTGPITFTLSSGSGIAAGDYVRILIGTNASFGGSGAFQITNPSVTASYRIFINTYDASVAPQDNGVAMVAILPGIGVDLNQNKVNPAVLSNGLPSGTIPSNISGVLLSLNTDVFATCRYATSTGVAYDTMTNNFTFDSLHLFHTATVLSTITNGTTYNYYVRCVDFAGNKNPTDYVISFTAGNPTGVGAGGATAGSGGGGGGGGAPYPALSPNPTFTMSGMSFPNGAISVLEDGQKVFVPSSVDSSGNFSFVIANVTQGTHSFTVNAVDGGGNQLSSFTTTLTTILGTTNSVTGVVMPPSIILTKSTISPGSADVISGLAEPSSTVEIVVASQADLQNPVDATTTADRSGSWSYSLATAGFPVDTYIVTARSRVSGLSASNFSNAVYLGVGQAPKPKAGSADLNGDGKVNLVDFSIMLSHWGTNFARADLSHDGTVNLVDFSILLSQWTG